MKKRLILIIGILIALIAIWQSVMGEPSFRSMISHSSHGVEPTALQQEKAGNR